MNKSEKLKTLPRRQAGKKRKIKFKYFLLAHMLTLFFVVAPAYPVSSADNLAGGIFDFNQKSYYSEPFSKLIEFLNAKKANLKNTTIVSGASKRL